MLALAGVGTGTTILAGSDAPFAGWPVATIAALAAGSALAVADRLRERRHVLLFLTPVGVIGLGWLLASGPEFARVGAGIVGMNLGWFCNRLCFGVVRDVPGPRVRRERSA